jgi:energy-coupling factor transporter ATP-binding protein EcfA2
VEAHGGTIELCPNRGRAPPRSWTCRERPRALPDLAATEALAARIAGRLRPGDVVALSGGLGAGKTTLARAVIAALGHEGEVPSPSFAIIECYDPPAVRLPLSMRISIGWKTLPKWRNWGWTIIAWGRRCRMARTRGRLPTSAVAFQSCWNRRKAGARPLSSRGRIG